MNLCEHFGYITCLVVYVVSSLRKQTITHCCFSDDIKWNDTQDPGKASQNCIFKWYLAERYQSLLICVLNTGDGY